MVEILEVKQVNDTLAEMVALFRVELRSYKGIVSKPNIEAGREEMEEYLSAKFPVYAALVDGEYDLVLVNIVADVIIGLAPVLPNFLTEKSTLICSGILDVRLEDVCAALTQAGLTVTAVKAKEDWRSVTARKE